MARIATLALQKQVKRTSKKDTLETLATYPKVNSVARFDLGLTFEDADEKAIGKKAAEKALALYGASVITPSVVKAIEDAAGVDGGWTLSHLLQEFKSFDEDKHHVVGDNAYNSDNKQVAQYLNDVLYRVKSSDGSFYYATYTFRSFFKTFVETPMLEVAHDSANNGENITFNLYPVKSAGMQYGKKALKL